MVMYKMSKYDVIILQQQEIQKRDLGLGQTSNLSRDLVKLMKSLTSGSVEFVWMSLDHPTRSIRLLQTDTENVWRSSPGETSIFICDELN